MHLRNVMHTLSVQLKLINHYFTLN